MGSGAGAHRRACIGLGGAFALVRLVQQLHLRNVHHTDVAVVVTCVRSPHGDRVRIAVYVPAGVRARVDPIVRRAPTVSKRGGGRAGFRRAKKCVRPYSTK
jgi:hypothetical protein